MPTFGSMDFLYNTFRINISNKYIGIFFQKILLLDFNFPLGIQTPASESGKIQMQSVSRLCFLYLTIWHDWYINRYLIMIIHLVQGFDGRYWYYLLDLDFLLKTQKLRVFQTWCVRNENSRFVIHKLQEIDSEPKEHLAIYFGCISKNLYYWHKSQ